MQSAVAAQGRARALPMAMAAAAMSAPAHPSGTVATPSHAFQGSTIAVATAMAAAARETDTERIATYGATTLAAPRATATTRATPSDLPAIHMALPSTQNGRGSQLVPLGSSRGACANCCAMTVRA